MSHTCFIHVLLEKQTILATFLPCFGHKICWFHKKIVSLQKNKLINHVVEGVTEAAVKG